MSQESRGERGGPRGGIRVSGSGVASGRPDVARISLTATAARPTLTEALAASEDAARRIRAALARFGVTGADAATSRMTVQPEQVWEHGQTPRVTGYRAEHGITATVRDLAAVGAALGEALTAAGDDARLDDVTFAVEDSAALLAQARRAAWDDALGRARQLAELSGRELGAVLTVSEGDGPGGGPPMPFRVAKLAAAAEVAPEPGQVQVGVSLRVHWALGGPVETGQGRA